MNRPLMIDGATVLSMDERIGDYRAASILVEDDRIAAVGADVTMAGAEVIDGRGLIAVPGLVDAHRHLWQSVLTLIAADADLNGYFAEVPGRLAPVFSAEDAHDANLIGALQALDAGVTSVFDWSHLQHTPEHSDALVDALQKSGIRAVFGYGFPNTEPAWSMDSERPVPEDIRRVRESLLPSDDAPVTMAMSVRGPEQSTLEVTAHDLGVARELGLRVSMHAGNGAFGLPYRAIERLHDAGLMGPDIQYIHCTSLSDESIQRIADSGGGFAATPTVELQMQFGYPATTRFLARGVRPGLGVDVVTSTDYGLFAQMACAFQAARLQALEQGTPSINTRDVLGFATIDGARSIGLDQAVGSLTPGKKADILLLRPPPLVAVNDPVAFVVLAADNQSVDTVIVDGRIRKRDGKLIDVDLAAIHQRLQRCLEGLLKRSGFAPPSHRLIN